MVARLIGGGALAVVLSLACTTAPCACSEPGSRLALYGVATSSSTGLPVAGARVAVTISDQLMEGAPCSYPAQPSPDTPAPVTSDAAGRYRIEILSVARFRRCVILAATWGDPGTRLARTLPELDHRFGQPGTLDSVRADIVMLRE